MMPDMEKVIEGLKELHGSSETMTLIAETISLLKEQPEIVRCKDCKHGTYVVGVGMLPFVKRCGVDHELDWFCADGERW